MTPSPPDQPEGRPAGRYWRFTVVVITVALIKGAVLLWVIPPFQTPDEYGHYDYALFLAHLGVDRFVRGDFARRPTLAPTTYATDEVGCLAGATGNADHLAAAVVPRGRPSLDDMLARAGQCGGLDTSDALAARRQLNAVFNYPPLYYGLVAAVRRLAGVFGVNPLWAYYAARATTLLLFLAALALAAATMRALNVSRLTTGAALGFLACHPQLSMLSVAVQPDILGLLLVTAGSWLLVSLARTASVEAAYGLGISLGLLMLTKLHLALPLAAAGLTVALVARFRDRIDRVVVAAAVMRSGFTALVVGGWYSLRGWVMFGDLTGTMGSVDLPGMGGGPSANLARWFSEGGTMTFRSYWGYWGWLDYTLPAWAWPVLVGVCLVPALTYALVGLASLDRQDRAASDRPPERPRSPWPDLGRLAVAASLALFAAEMVLIAAVYGPLNNQGRHWLPYAMPQALYFGGVAALATRTWVKPLLIWAARRWRALGAAAVGCAVAASIGALLVPAAVWSTGLVEVELRSANDGRAELYADTGYGFNASERASTAVRTRDGVVRVRLPLCAARVFRLRFDPAPGAGGTTLYSVRVLGADGTLLAALPLAGIRPLNNETTVNAAGNGVAITGRGTGSDPMVGVPLPGPLDFAARGGVTTWLRVQGQRALRRSPALAQLPLFAGTFALWAAGLAWLAAAGRRQRVEGAAVVLARLSRGWAIVLPLILLGLTVELTVRTMAFYR